MDNITLLDHCFVYSKSLRLVGIDKLLLRNSFSCPNIYFSTLVVELTGLDNFDNTRLVAAMFILRLLSGKRPYIVKFGLFQTFYDKQCDATVQVTITGTEVFNIVSTLSSNILPFLSKVDFLKFVKVEKNKGCVIYFTIFDLSFIRVVETHSIFFK